MVRFTKMHGAGNDFICLDAVAEPALANRPDLGTLAVQMCDRRQGVGGDGLIVIGPSAEPGSDVSMRMFNADGSESAMCGNGLRCVAKYAVEHGLAGSGGNGTLVVHTGAGAMRVKCRRGRAGIEAVTVDMGRPRLSPPDIPFDPERLERTAGPAYRIRAGDATYEAVFVSMGNPHAAIYVDDVAAVDVAAIGPILEHHAAFPQRMNVHFVEVTGPGEATIRTWERGSGITGACGSGASAVCVAGVLTARTGRELLAHLPGGDLELRWDEQGDRVFMTGPAVEVFSGEWSR